MTLLEISTKRKRGRLFQPEEELPIETIELMLLEANILFDKQQAILVITSPYSGSKEVVTPDHWTVHHSGYFQAADDEMNALRQAGYQLPDWRELTMADIRHQYPAFDPAWKPQPPESSGC